MRTWLLNSNPGCQRITGQRPQDSEGKGFPTENYIPKQMKLTRLRIQLRQDKDACRYVESQKTFTCQAPSSQEAAGGCAPSKQRSKLKIWRMRGVTWGSCKGLIVKGIPGCSQSLLVHPEGITKWDRGSPEKENQAWLSGHKRTCFGLSYFVI